MAQKKFLMKDGKILLVDEKLLESPVPIESRIYGVRFATNVINGTRIYDSRDMIVKVGENDGVKVRNDFDNAEIYKDIKPVRLEARDSNGNVLKDNEGNTIYNDLVWIPNFYYRFDEGNDYTEFCVSSVERSDFYPAFVVNGEVKKGAYVGAYFTTTLKDKAQTNNTPCCGCQEGQFPRVNLHGGNIDGYMCYVKDESNGLNLTKLHGAEDLRVYTAISMLFMIEFATRDCQSIFKGISSESWTNILDTTLKPFNNPDNVASYTTNRIVTLNGRSETNVNIGDSISIYDDKVTSQYWIKRAITDIDKTTYSDKTILTLDNSIVIGNSGSCYVVRSTGSQVGSLNDDVNSSARDGLLESKGLAHFKYRGMEDIYGNLWNILSGFCKKITVEDGQTKHQLYELENPLSTATTGGKVLENASLSTKNGYVSKLGVNSNDGCAMYPIETNAASNTYYCDYHYMDSPSSTTYRELLCGGLGHYGAYDGLIYFRVYAGFWAASYSYGLRPSIFI